jgi:cytochrome b
MKLDRRSIKNRRIRAPRVKLTMSETIYVWDRFVRFFHWSLVLLFVTSYLSGEEEHWIHPYSGYGIIGLVALRILWGFIGSEYARFASFLGSPMKAIDYLKRLLTGRKPQRYIGHNPAGGMMVLAMLATLTVVGFSGLKLYALEEGKGPFADHRTGVVHQAYADSDREEHHDRHDDESGRGEDREEDEEAEELWEEIHEIAVNVMILLVVLHIGGVYLSSRAHGESLVRAMITGRKAVSTASSPAVRRSNG